MESQTITKTQLNAVLLQWEKNHRDGFCCTPEEAAAMSADHVAAANTDYIWTALAAAPTGGAR